MKKEKREDLLDLVKLIIPEICTCPHCHLQFEGEFVFENHLDTCSAPISFSAPTAAPAQPIDDLTNMLGGLLDDN